MLIGAIPQHLKPFQTILIITGVAALAVAPMLIVDNYKSRKCEQEALRMMAIETNLFEKLAAYKEASGHYPDSIAELSFTNSPQELELLPDLQKIRYTSNGTNFYLGYVGLYGRQGSMN